MGPHLSQEALEALARGGIPPAEPAAADASEGAFLHLRGCAVCLRELAWLRAELRLVARRKDGQGPLPPALWDAIAARLPAGKSGGAPRPGAAGPAPRFRPARALGRRPRLAAGLAASAAAAAAVVVLAVRPASRDAGSLGTGDEVAAVGPSAASDDLPSPGVARALDRAEIDTQAAARVLETEVRARRINLDASTAGGWDESLASARGQLDSARALAGDDVEARMRVLDGYAVYLRSLRALVVFSEEAAP